MLYLDGFELRLGFNWDTVYTYNINMVTTLDRA